MSLLLPILDDKPFLQIAEEERALIPSTAPEWTDHNLHDPGITFLDLFAWLAEIEHYRLDQTSAASYERFFSLAGVTPFGPRAAEVAITFEFSNLTKGPLVRAYSRVTPIGNESLPFQTVRDLYLTAAKLDEVVTRTSEREIVKTQAESKEVGHYEAFGPAPEAGDSLELKFVPWFNEPQAQLAITLFEGDLPRRAPIPTEAAGFVPSASVRWEYRIASEDEPEPRWAPLDVIEDGTLSFSRSGDLIFRTPADPAAIQHKTLRAVVSEGKYEIPPRIVSIRTNTIRARQVETIINEELGAGLGMADQVVRLKKAPVFINSQAVDGPFQTGEVVDWKALVDRLQRAGQLYKSPLRETVLYIASTITEIAGALPDFPDDEDDAARTEKEFRLAQSFNDLLNRSDFYQRSKFAGVPIPEELRKAADERACRKQTDIRHLNRYLLQQVFPDLFISDRFELQTGSRAARVEDEFQSWTMWQRVDDFLKSGPDDRHYVFDPQTGVIQFGNGLNGRVPATTELIRARFYRYSQLEKGNLPANVQWGLDVQLPQNSRAVRQVNPAPASGGRDRETVAETRTRSREVFRKQTAVVTANDYQNLVLNTPGLRIARVKVKPNFNPLMPKLMLPGQVTIIVLPQPPPRQAFPDAPPPEPSQGFLRNIRRHIETRRLVTTNVHVIGPEYVEVRVNCRVFLKKRASETAARESIDRALSEFFDLVSGGPDKGGGWPFGRAVFPSEISQLLAKLPAVDYVTEMALNDLKPGEALRLPYNGLPAPARDKHSIKLVPFEKRGRPDQPEDDRQTINSCQGGGGCG